MYNIILKGLHFCISYCFEGEFKYSWPNIILSTMKVCIMIKPFMYWGGGVCVCVYYVPVKVLADSFSIVLFLLFMSIMFPLGMFFCIPAHWFELVFHKVGMHD